MTCRHDWIFAWRDHSHAWVCDRCGAYQTETPDAVIVWALVAVWAWTR